MRHVCNLPKLSNYGVGQKFTPPKQLQIINYRRNELGIFNDSLKEQIILHKMKLLLLQYVELFPSSKLSKRSLECMAMPNVMVASNCTADAKIL